MLKKNYKIISLFLTFSILIIILSGCFGFNGGNVGSTVDSQKKVKLKMILLGDRPVIYDKIYSKVNQMLEKDINATVEVDYISWGDAEKKYPLLFAANEEFDLVFSANWRRYNQQATKNSYYELTNDMLEKYAPTTYKTVPQVAWEQSKVQGKVFMVPNTGVEYSTPIFLIRGDLRKKHNIAPLMTIDDFTNYLTVIAEKEPSIIPFVDMSGKNNVWFTGRKGYLLPSNVVGSFFYDMKDPTGRIFNYVFTDDYAGDVYKTREFSNKKLWPSDIISNKSTNTMFENGKAASLTHNLDTASQKAEVISAKHPEWEIEMYDLSKERPKIVNSYLNNGMSLNRTTKNPERSLQLIELFRNDKRYYDLTWYGIEGEHWESVGDKQYKNLNATLPDKERYNPGCVWGWKNEDLLRTNINEFPGKSAIFESWKENTILNPVLGFSFDDAKVKNELAAISSVDQQYGGPLFYGMVNEKEIDSSIKTYREKLKDAGVDKVLVEIQQQVDAYIKSIK